MKHWRSLGSGHPTEEIVFVRSQILYYSPRPRGWSERGQAG